MTGYNDMIQTPHAFGSPREQLWSFGPLGVQLWNSIRALDFLESLEDVDATKIARVATAARTTADAMTNRFKSAGYSPAPFLSAAR